MAKRQDTTEVAQDPALAGALAHAEKLSENEGGPFLNLEEGKAYAFKVHQVRPNRKTKFGFQTMLDVVDGNGELRTIACGKVLGDTIIADGIKAGDTVALKSFGKPQGKRYNKVRCVKVAD